MNNTLTVCEYFAENTAKVNAKTITLSKWLERWLTYYSISIKPTTQNSYKATIDNHINRVLGKFCLADITSELLQLFYNTLSLGVELAKPLSPKTIRNVHGVLHKALQTAVGFGYLNKNPADMVMLPKKDKKVIRPMNNEQICLFLKTASASPYFNFFMLALFTGLRQSELIGLTWDCIDFNSKTILVNKQLANIKGIGFKFIPCKNSKERYLNPADFVFEILKKIKAEQDNDIFVNNIWSGYRMVFINDKGNHLTQYGVYNAFKKIMRKLEMPDFRFHDLRHTYAVLSLQAGDDYKTLQYNMGHYSAAFTLDTYGFCTDLMKNESAQRMQIYYCTHFNG